MRFNEKNTLIFNGIVQVFRFMSICNNNLIWANGDKESNGIEGKKLLFVVEREKKQERN